jgi:hypothetical protein
VFAAVIRCTSQPASMTKIMQLIAITPQQSQNSSQQPSNPPQQIYEFHFNPRQLFGTTRHLSALYFAAWNLLLVALSLRAKIIQLIDRTPQQSQNSS